MLLFIIVSVVAVVVAIGAYVVAIGAYQLRWDLANSEAERQIKEAQEKIAKLEGSVKTFKEMRDIGEPFLDEKAEQNGVKL
jgi:cell division protein FtsL